MVLLAGQGNSLAGLLQFDALEPAGLAPGRTLEGLESIPGDDDGMLASGHVSGQGGIFTFAQQAETDAGCVGNRGIEIDERACGIRWSGDAGCRIGLSSRDMKGSDCLAVEEFTPGLDG